MGLLWTKEDAKRRLVTNLQSAEQRRKNLEDFDTDADQAKRLERCECRTCYYLRRGQMAGQAFTAYKCVHCGQEKWHGNTAVPFICPECAHELQVCTKCGADLDEDAAKVQPRRAPTKGDLNAIHFLLEVFGTQPFDHFICAQAVQQVPEVKMPGISDNPNVWKKRLAGLYEIRWLKRERFKWVVSDVGRTVFIETVVYGRATTSGQ